MPHPSTPLHPAFLKLEGRPVLVVGGGAALVPKIEALLKTGAIVTVVAPRVDQALLDLDVVVQRRAFEPEDVAAVWYVLAGAPPDVNRQVAAVAEEHRVFVNAVDQLDAATAYLAGVVERDGVTLAISTHGRAPGVAALLRRGIDAMLPDDLDTWIKISDESRSSWQQAAVPHHERVPRLLATLQEHYSR